MKLKEGGKEHEAGNPRCPVCDQRAPSGGVLMASIKHFPYVDSSGNPPCGGLVHSEIFGDERAGWDILYQCEKCGSLH